MFGRQHHVLILSLADLLCMITWNLGKGIKPRTGTRHQQTTLCPPRRHAGLVKQGHCSTGSFPVSGFLCECGFDPFDDACSLNIKIISLRITVLGFLDNVIILPCQLLQPQGVIWRLMHAASQLSDLFMPAGSSSLLAHLMQRSSFFLLGLIAFIMARTKLRSQHGSAQFIR